MKECSSMSFGPLSYIIHCKKLNPKCSSMNGCSSWTNSKPFIKIDIFLSSMSCRLSLFAKIEWWCQGKKPQTHSNGTYQLKIDPKTHIIQSCYGSQLSLRYYKWTKFKTILKTSHEQNSRTFIPIKFEYLK